MENDSNPAPIRARFLITVQAPYLNPEIARYEIRVYLSDGTMADTVFEQGISGVEMFLYGCGLDGQTVKCAAMDLKTTGKADVRR
jgi:hypothetical protein